VTRKQTVLYNLFDWPTRPNCRLVVLGVANTMDLPERMLPRIASRLGLRRISFAPYTHQQIQTVIHSRLESVDAFNASAIELCARKVASFSGDLRKALQICRHACELARREGARHVELCHVELAAKQLHSSPYVAALQGMPLLHRLAVVAAVQTAAENLEGSTELQLVMERTAELARALQVEEASYDELSRACSCLTDVCLLQPLGAPGARRAHKVVVHMQADDVAYALKTDPLLARVATALLGA
jgi:origin recognition complex subunit 1